ncbi:PGPGW domain-containing protein [Svornostia abyssi]|uniref:PGPGW domain-containing protein n=1 Tax=Svornostia abyssi TaxID=2898438 RepID=A0ABY5PAZ3_9ACTN|nr:PGPGW domain-containing protein [Parviterribacteraceae bacterium J379]
MSAQEETPERPKLIRKLQEQRDVHKARPKVIRVLYAAVGITLLLLGLIMLVTPGPAFAIIPIGLFILALEFSWAEAALEKSLEQADKAKQKAAETTTTQRVLTATAGVLAVAAVVAWALLGDIPVAPV